MRRVARILVAQPFLVSSALAGPFDTGHEREGYKWMVSPPLKLMLKNAVPRADGMLVIPAGQQSAEGNAYHQALCEAYGGMDATNDGDVAFSEGGGDVFTCAFPTAANGAEAKREAIPPFASEIAVDGEGRVYRWAPARPPWSGSSAPGGAAAANGATPRRYFDSL